MIRTLIKVNIAALFSGVFKRLKSGRKVKPVAGVLIVLLVIYIVGAIFFAVGAIFYGICAPLFDSGIGWFYFTLEGILVFALCFIGGVFMVQTQIFAAHDNELLLSMPIKPSAILTGRLAALMIIEYLFEAVIMIPVFLVLIIRGYISQIPALGIVFFFLAAILLPLIAVAIGCLIGWLIALASSRMRNKNVLTLILSLAFLVAYFWLYSRMMSNINTLITRGVEIAEAVRRAVFPAYYFGASIADGDIVSFLLFALCAVLPFVVMCILLSLSFVKLTSAGRGARKAKYREKALRVSGVRKALLKRELQYLWSMPMYILNTMLGAIVSLALAVVLIIRPGLITGLFDQAAGVLSGLFDPGLTGAVLLSALSMLNFVAAPSISLEGKRLWIGKSLPVQTRDILLSKVGLHLTVCGLPGLAAGIVCIAVLPMSGVIPAALTLIMPAAVTLMFALLGVTLNLAFPRFDWINAIQPIKQGASSMLSMFGGMALLIALALVYIFLLAGVFALDIYLLLCTIIIIVVSAVLYARLISVGSKKYESL